MTKAGDVVETAAGELDYIVGPEGNQIKLGLLPPDAQSPTNVFATFSNTFALRLSFDEIKKIVSDTQRRKIREIFGPETIKDQDGRGACQGYGSAKCIEECRELNGQEPVKLSGDFAYSLVNGGRDQGSQLANGFKAAAEVGYCPEDTPGLVRWEYRKARMPQAAFEAAKRFRGIEGYICETEEEFATAMALGFIGVVAVHVAGAYSQLDRYGVSRGGNGVGNHAVCCDDIVWDAQLGKFKYDSPNSWKRTWGDNGRCYYTFDQHFRQTIRIHKFYVFPTVTQDSEGKNPPPLRMA